MMASPFTILNLEFASSFLIFVNTTNDNAKMRSFKTT